jgi:YD repeat-containing protein
VNEQLYDGYGRLWAVNHYASAADFAAGLVSQRDEFEFDAHGRQSGFVRYSSATPTALASNVSAATSSSFEVSRTEQTFRNARGQVIHKVSPEGVVSYGYDALGRTIYMAVGKPTFSPTSVTPINLASQADRVTHYGYDSLGRLVSVTEDATPANSSGDPQVTTSHTLDLHGRMDQATTTTGGNSQSVTTDYQYDALGRLDSQTDSDGSGDVLASYDYTVRPDGKRTGLTETTWFDQDADGVRDAGEVMSTSYQWSYDDVGRLTDEVLDHWDDAFDQAESFTYDLTGNRVGRELDYGSAAKADEAITYGYDANDRLEFEWLDNDADPAVDQTTVYGYDQTQRTEQSVYAGFVDASTPTGSYPATVG